MKIQAALLISIIGLFQTIRGDGIENLKDLSKRSREKFELLSSALTEGLSVSEKARLQAKRDNLIKKLKLFIKSVTENENFFTPTESKDFGEVKHDLQMAEKELSTKHGRTVPSQKCVDFVKRGFTRLSTKKLHEQFENFANRVLVGGSKIIIAVYQLANTAMEVLHPTLDNNAGMGNTNEEELVVGGIKHINLEDLARKTRAKFILISAVLAEGLTPEQVAKLLERSPVIKRRLKYFEKALGGNQDTSKEAEDFRTLVDELKASENELSSKTTRGLPGKIFKMFKKGMNHLGSEILYANVHKHAGEVTGTGFKIVSAASKLASSVLEVLRPSEEEENVTSQEEDEQEQGKEQVQEHERNKEEQKRTEKPFDPYTEIVLV